LFILTVLAVAIHVTYPVFWYTLVTVALKISRATRGAITVGLVRVVAAIVVTIALPKFGDAHTIVTSKLIRRAGTSNAWACRIGVGFDATWTETFSVCHYHAIRTKAHMTVAWCTQTDMRARVVCRALVFVGLHAMPKDLQVHQAHDLKANYCVDSNTVIFVGDKDHRLFPIIPVHVVLQNGDCKWMRHARIVGDNLFKSLTLKV